MDRVLRWKAHLRLEPSGDDQLVLLSERQRFLVDDRVAVLVAPLLDGQRTVESVVLALRDQVAPLEVLGAVERLVRQGYLTEVDVADDSFSPLQRAFLEALGVKVKTAKRRLDTARVAIASLMEGADLRPLTEALTASGIRWTPTSGGWPEASSACAPLTVVLVDDYLDPKLEQMNLEALSGGHRYLIAKPRGVAPWVGPLFQPNEGPCWECLAHRLRANRPVEQYLQKRHGTERPMTVPIASLGASEALALGFVALVVARELTGTGIEGLESTLFSLELSSLQLSRHSVARRGHCRACGHGPTQDAEVRPVELVSRPKRFTAEGGYRVSLPDEVCQRLEPHISPLIGIVASVGPLGGRDAVPGPVYGATWLSRPIGHRLCRDDFHRASLGKGRTPAQARASALGEAVERWSAQLQGNELRVRATAAELGRAAVHPNDLLHFSEAQYARHLESLEIPEERALHVPTLYIDQRIDWTPVWSLDEQRVRYLPTSYCYCDLTGPDEEAVCPYDSNGDAAGSCLEEAVLQGFLEVVERDAVSLWWYNRVRRPGVDLASFREPYFLEIQAAFEKMGWQLSVLDLTTDTGLPCFVTYGHLPGSESFSIGFGCHLDARLGVMRALTEFNQLYQSSRRRRLPWRSTDIADPSYLWPDPHRRARVAKDYDARLVENADLRDDVALCVDLARRVGLSTLVLERTRPDVPLSVVKVVVPGMRHFWPRFGPGRLYDCPVRLGWVGQPLSEAELNPLPLLL